MKTKRIKPDPALVAAAKIATFDEQADDFWKEAQAAEDQISAKKKGDDSKVQPRRIRR